jgi:hypothetical protein
MRSEKSEPPKTCREYRKPLAWGRTSGHGTVQKAKVHQVTEHSSGRYAIRDTPTVTSGMTEAIRAAGAAGLA